MANTSYHRIIRKLVVGFGNLFKDITLVRYNPNATESERFIVPIVYATKENYIQRLQADPNLDKKVQVTLPIMSFEMTGLEYDSARKQNTNFKSFAKTTTGVIAQYNPVPYSFDFNLYLYVRNIEDGTQIIEHILPYFTPDYTIKLNLVPEMGIVKEIPIILNSAVNEIEYEGPARSSETRLIIWTLNFTVKGFIFGKTSEAEVIQTSITNILNSISSNDVVEFNMLPNHITGTYGQIYQLDEIVYQGYSPTNSTATGKVLSWQNGILKLTNVSGNFVSDSPIKGFTSNANYIFNSYNIAPQTTSRIIITPTPTDATTNDLYTFTTNISETPNLNPNTTVPNNFVGDLQTQLGSDDLENLPEKQTDLE